MTRETETSDDFDEDSRGGGVRLSALLLALTCTLGWAAAAPHEATAAEKQAVDLWPACTSSDDAIGQISISCKVSVIMSDDSSIIGTARYENSSSGYNPNYSWSFDSSIKPYVKSDGGYRAKAVNANGVSYEKGNPLDSKVVLGLKNRPPVDTAGTVINQSPTAGAPVSDLTIPALAVGGGLAALGFGLSRRRRA